MWTFRHQKAPHRAAQTGLEQAFRDDEHIARLHVDVGRRVAAAQQIVETHASVLQADPSWTEKVCGIVEAGKTPRAWWIAFLLSVGLTVVLFANVAYLISKGVADIGLSPLANWEMEWHAAARAELQEQVDEVLDDEVRGP